MQSPLDILRQYWGYSQFRPLQEDIIGSVLQGSDTLALLPTGGGKSVCYQVPALAREGVTLVISPLIALMQDQTARLKALDINAACIHAGMHYADVKRTLENTMHGGYKLLYVSPERLQTSLFQDYLPSFDLNLIAIDEAHCISQWGHDFRPDYLRIAEIRAFHPRVPMLALTATATEKVQRDIISHLQLRQPAVYKNSFRRDNIFYSIQYTENKNAALLQQFDQLQGSAIVYCRSRKQTEAIGKTLQQNGIPALHYHAGMGKDKRTETQERWMSDEVRIVAATTAFGMGIDKPDVRTVLHYDAPENIEAYYQEAGRAGRDGKPSVATTLFNQTDINRLEQSIELQYPPEEYLRQVYQSVAEYLQIPIGTAPDKYFNFDLADFCRKFKLNALYATHALKLLEQEGLWTMSDAVYQPATVYMLADRHVVDNLQQAYPQLHYFLTMLLRLHGTLFHYPTAVRITAVAKHARMKKEEAEQYLRQLQRMEILEYNVPKDGPQMFFHHTRADSKHLLINMQRIYHLKQQHIARTKAMTDFLQNDRQCRERQILAYFGETDTKDCGHCDVCTSRRKPKDHTELILQTAMANSSFTLQQLTSQVSVSEKESLIARVRRMVDDGRLNMNADGTLSATKQHT